MIPTGGDLTVTDAIVFDGVSEAQTEASVRIVDGEIVEFGATVSHGPRVVSAGGNSVTPGLIDAHFHAWAIGLRGDVIEASPLSYLALAGQHRLTAALRRGFTTVRDVAGGDPGFAKAISEGLIPSPRYFYTGAALSQTGGHGDPRPGDLDLCFHGGHMCEVVDGVDALRVAVRDRFRRGAHAIKVMTSGGVVSLTDPIRVPQYSAAELKAVSEEATRRGSYVAAHAYSPEAIRHSILNGVRSIEHGNLLDRPTAELMAEHSAYLVPTLAAYDAMDRRGDALGLAPVSQAKNSEVLAAGKGAIELAILAGVSVGFGSDLMGDLADDQLVGIRLQAEVAGALATLRSVTSVNADLLRRPDLGRIAVGAVGDLVIWDGDPVADISVVWDESRPRRIVQGGVLR